ncbi:hypothetical protein JD974_15840 [Chromobacterium haemolyticum]|uniref:DUF1484 domain-containing protein n=2 Tax=Chromobacterium TaxID=535 RepID=A0ABS3GK42_9NEIS|nr:hypothetical protein [Chromobacterium haemolyticum]MBK0415881.1 hypothetical protein [Chromobacterium haemolyticum]MBO0415108.1 hypothetical protein [Chromobacterium haemolyticum]MBO0498369.1 hypothetical protein [Chromobacterium haemolyticum]MDH0340344.1 hypothetical protein [Chromobacterium haemolyticum]MDH0340493.1 hypothetical protein [Chromobacterium haemolyticum]
MTFSTFPPAMPPPACPHCAGQQSTPAAVPVMEQLHHCSQRLPAVAGDMVLLGELGQQLNHCYVELDTALLRGVMDMRAAHTGLLALITLLERRDEPLLFTSEDALALLEPIQQRLKQGLEHFNGVL